MDERALLTASIMDLDRQLVRLFQSGQADNWLSVDLTMPQLKVLLIVQGSGSATASQLARGLGVSLPTITGIVDRLREQGLVTRTEDPQDRRVTRVAATEAGDNLVTSLTRHRRERWERLLRRLDVETLRDLARSLERLHAAAVEEAEYGGRESAALPPVEPPR